MQIKEVIKRNEKLKRFIHYLLIPKNQARPRLWVKWFVNPFIHKYSKGATVCRRARMDILPFNDFSLGKNSTIEDFATVNNGVGAVHIGAETRVGIGNVVIGPVSIGNNVIIAQNVVMSGLNHSYDAINIPIKDQPVTTNQITIEDECWIGANSVITAGTIIGRHSVIAAGAIVTKDVPPYCVAAGSPARVIKQYDQETGNWLRV